MEDQASGLHQRIQWIGLVGGPVAAVICYLALPDSYRGADGQLVEFSHAGRVTLAIMVWMAVWWLTEALHISITALLPLLLFPIFGAVTGAESAAERMKMAAAPYAHPMVFLFMGGFILALSMQRWGLDRRMALLTLRLVGSRPANMVGGVMLATAALSAFVSNTATTAMMLPIALSVITLVQRRTSVSAPTDDDDAILEETGQSNFATCMLLGLAYSASIGGLATIIGTPTNALAVSFIRETYQREVGFLEWLTIGLPMTIVFVPIVWILLTRIIYPIQGDRIAGGAKLIEEELSALGATKRGEWITLAVFICTAICWICRPWMTKIELHFGGGAIKPFAGVTDTGIAVAAALALFVIPVNLRRREFTMDWPTAEKLPWGILLLFGGGLSLAAAVQANGVAEFIGSQTSRFAGMPTIFLVLAVTTLVIFMTELTSNTPTTATLLPVLAALAPSLGVNPYLLIVPATLSASCAFMMPVATPPNAIVFGSGYLKIPQMIKAGWWLNLVGIVLVTAFTMLLLGRILGLDF